MSTARVRLHNRLHHVQHVVSELPREPRRTPLADGKGGFGHTEATTVLAGIGVVITKRDLTPALLIVMGPDPDRAGECIGVGHSQDAAGAVQLDVGEVGTPDAEAGEEGRLGTAFELDYARYKGRSADLERFPLTRSAIRRPLRVEDPCHAGHLADRTEKANQRREVIGSHVEQRTPTWLVKEGGVRMPVLGASAEDEAGCGQGLSQLSLLEQPKASLNSRAEHGVRRTGDGEAACLGCLQDAQAIRASGGERLLAIDMLAGCESGQI